MIEWLDASTLLPYAFDIDLSEARNMDFVVSQVKLFDEEIFGIWKIKLPNESHKECCVISYLKYDMFILSNFAGKILFKYKISEPLALEWNIRYDKWRKFMDMTKKGHW